jgi:hypothetical protein
VKQEANRTHSEKLRAWKQMRQAWSAARMVARVLWKDTPSEPEYSDEEEEEEGHVTPPPPSQLRKTLPLFGDIHSRQAGIAIGLC